MTRTDFIMKNILFPFLLLLGVVSFAQPSSDIYLFDMVLESNNITLKKGQNITNRKGYDNQPSSFGDSGLLYYTSIDSSGQADIYAYDYNNHRHLQKTETSESEYSPTLTPDGQFFSVIQVEKDNTQRLWKFPLKGGSPQLVLENIKPVGYHCWYGKEQLVLFVLGEPNTLQKVDVATGKAIVIDENVGRCIQRIPESSKISYVKKKSDKEWFINYVDMETNETSVIIHTLPSVEDYVWVTENLLLMGKGNKLYKYTLGLSNDWEEVADFSELGIKNINRMAVSQNRDKLAIVVTETIL